MILGTYIYKREHCCIAHAPLKPEERLVVSLSGGAEHAACMRFILAILPKPAYRKICQVLIESAITQYSWSADCCIRKREYSASRSDLKRTMTSVETLKLEARSTGGIRALNTRFTLTMYHLGIEIRVSTSSRASWRKTFFSNLNKCPRRYNVFFDTELSFQNY